jgi:DNA-binding NarL/FixJ family response regulator
MNTSQIAERLCVSTQTVRSHFKNIYPKIGAHSRADAVVFALQYGLSDRCNTVQFDFGR